MMVSVSILKEYDRLINTIKKVNDSTANYLHIDVMDGKFVEGKTFPVEVVKDIVSISTKPLDIHLMVNDYETVKKYVLLKPEYLTFHIEILKDEKLIDYVKQNNVKVGLAINPETSIDELKPYLDKIDLVLFMSVHPGKGGQEFIEVVLNKVKKARKLVNKNVILSIDGGINDTNINNCKEAGCDMVVAGSYITNSNNYNEKIQSLK